MWFESFQKKNANQQIYIVLYTTSIVLQTYFPLTGVVNCWLVDGILGHSYVPYTKLIFEKHQKSIVLKYHTIYKYMHLPVVLDKSKMQALAEGQQKPLDCGSTVQHRER